MSDLQWFEARILAQSVGLLDDAETERFEQLRESDPQCQAAWREFAGDDELSGEFHMPPGMVAQWPAVAERLGELERRAVEGHLRSCESCAEEVALFGSAARSKPRSVEPRRAGTPSPRRDQWRIALSGGIAGALAMAAVLLLMFSPGPEPDSGGALPWAAPTRVRSDQLPAFARVAVGAQAREIGLNLAVPQDIDPIRPAEISVYAPDSALIQQFEIPAAELQRGALVLLLRSERPFQPGDHRVLFTQPGIETELWFLVERPAE